MNRQQRSKYVNQFLTDLLSSIDNPSNSITLAVIDLTSGKSTFLDMSTIKAVSEHVKDLEVSLLKVDPEVTLTLLSSDVNLIQNALHHIANCDDSEVGSGFESPYEQLYNEIQLKLQDQS
jgi:hypothetical protein